LGDEDLVDPRVPKVFSHIFDMKYEICKEYILCISITKSSLTPKLSKKKKVKISKSEGKNTWFFEIEKHTERKMT
jgi:hypothetical protein